MAFIQTFTYSMQTILRPKANSTKLKKAQTAHRLKEGFADNWDIQCTGFQTFV